MEPQYVAVYRDLYEHHWWWRAREEAVLKIIRSVHQSHSGDRVLDVGCGDGLFLSRLTEFGEVEGIEVDPLAVSDDGHFRSQIYVGDLASFQTSHRYELITMLDVLEHVDDPVTTLKRLAELLSKDGRCILTVPAYKSLWTSHDDLNRHRTRYTIGQFKAELTGSGLRLLEIHRLFHWLSLAKLGVRFKERLFGSRPMPPEVPPQRLNSLLLSLTRLELRQGRGLGLPFGSSLLAVLGSEESTL